MFHSITTNNSKAPLLRGFAITFSLKSCFPFSYWLPLCSNESFLWSGVSAITSTVLYVNIRSPCSHTFLYLVRTEMIQEITLSETKPSVTRCHILLDSLQHICLMHGMEVDYYKKLFQTIGNIIELIEKDDIPKYLLFLENAFPYMDNYNYHKGINEIIQKLKCLFMKRLGQIIRKWLNQNIRKFRSYIHRLVSFLDNSYQTF